MGCDIHAFIEVKIDNKWHHHGEVDIDRNYELFGLMAGVRYAHDDMIDYPRGLPNDTTCMTGIHYETWNGEAHSASYLTMDEMIYVEKYESYYIQKYIPAFSVFYCSLEELRDDYDMKIGEYVIEGVRLVFWFDN